MNIWCHFEKWIVDFAAVFPELENNVKASRSLIWNEFAGCLARNSVEARTWHVVTARAFCLDETRRHLVSSAIEICRVICFAIPNISPAAAPHSNWTLCTIFGTVARVSRHICYRHIACDTQINKRVHKCCHRQWTLHENYPNFIVNSSSSAMATTHTLQFSVFTVSSAATCTIVCIHRIR